MKNLYRILKNKNKEENSFQLKGSLTVESALVLPLFFLTMVIFAGILDLYRTGTLIQTSLCESAKELGMYAYCREKGDSPVGIVDSGVCAFYGKQKIRKKLEGEVLWGIPGGINGITLLGSRFDNNLVTLKASFLYHCPIGFFRLFPLKIEICGQARAWSGYQKEIYGAESREELVYITQWQSVYHTDRDCTYLELEIRTADLTGIHGQRNVYGERYQPCERCGEDGDGRGCVYITEMGNHYHTRRECGGLIRHVKEVKASEVQNLVPCSRCGGSK